MQSLQSKIHQSVRMKELNDNTLNFASNHKQPWTSDEDFTIMEQAGRIPTKELAVLVGRSYYGLQKHAELKGISLELNSNNHNNNPEHVKGEKRNYTKVHSITYRPIMRNGKAIGYKKVEKTYYQEQK